MTPVCLDVPSFFSQRIAKAGITGWTQGDSVPGWQALPSAMQRPTAAPCCWLTGSATIPPLLPEDVWLHCLPIEFAAWDEVPNVAMTQRIALAWQHSPFVVEHGFILCIGAPPPRIERAETILNALAPLPKGWLRVGDDAAALAFIAIVARQIGLNVAELASLALRGNEVDWRTIPAGQRAMMRELAHLAKGYIALSAPPEVIEVALAETPARQLAAWLLLLDACMDIGAD